MITAFRTDASLQIGSGHVMRCLTLATALRERGHECHFICREHPGNLINQVRDLGFAVTALSAGDSDFESVADGLGPPGAHAAWLGVTWQSDAEVTRLALQSVAPDWLVVDHYALDRRWEGKLREHCGRLMVVDDLADRLHDCDLLLDQNLGRAAGDYSGLVPDACVVLAGTPYALLRPEFSALREYSLRRRNPPRLRQFLITMGGVDRSNVTGRVLNVLGQCPLPQDCRIIVVMGLHAPWIQEIQAQARRVPWRCEVRVNVRDMAQLMADSDLAIGAAGGTSWERCALGLPAVMAVLAGNQDAIARSLVDANAALAFDPLNPFELAAHLETLVQNPDLLTEMCRSAAEITDGNGTGRVSDFMARVGIR
jgi:UDP-2,4-diacetamido-2,4,6-trideoxy-beta-L-altropyranose hydrolase